VLLGGDSQDAVDEPVGQTFHRAGSLHRTERRRPHEIEAQLHPRVGRVDTLTAGSRRPAEPPLQLPLGNDDGAGHAEWTGHRASMNPPSEADVIAIDGSQAGNLASVVENHRGEGRCRSPARGTRGRSGGHVQLVRFVRPSVVLLASSICIACSSPAPEPSPSPSAPATTSPSVTSPPPSSSPVGPSDVERTKLEGGGPIAIAVADGSLWVASYDSGTVSRVEPETGREVDTIQAASPPTFLLRAHDRIWVASYGEPKDARLSWIEIPGQQVEAGSHPPDLCCNLAADGHDIWGLDPSGWVVRFDGSSGREEDRFSVPINRNRHSNLVFAKGGVWVASDDSDLRRVDPRSGQVTHVETGEGIPFAVEGDLIWGASAGELWVVRATTAEIVRRVPIPDSIEVLWLAIDEASIWLAIRHPGYIGAVIRMDRASGEITTEVPMGTPAFVLAAFGAAWAVDYDTSELVRIAA
jgi:streptogramin lyase